MSADGDPRLPGLRITQIGARVASEGGERREEEVGRDI